MIKYVIGDATNPQGEGNKIIIHVSNDVRGWGAGFVLALSKKWKEPENAYKLMSKEDMILGAVQLVPVEKNIWVVNMIGQHDIKPMKGADNLIIPPIRYDAVLACLRKVAVYAKTLNATVHAPRFGAGLAGGNWSTIEKIINETLKDIDVTVYDLK
jgi:O-acetyl-ADP-ribose deacetylase (regulator of RNase III)